MQCLLGLRHWLVGENFRGARALDGRPRVCLPEHPQRSGTECITTSQDEEGVEHCAGAVFGLLAHEEYETPSTTWIESDSESAPPPSPVHDAPEDQGAIILPPQDYFSERCACCGGDIYGVLCCDGHADGKVVHYGCWGKWHQAVQAGCDLQMELGLKSSR